MSAPTIPPADGAGNSLAAGERLPAYIDVNDLADAGLTPRDVRQRCPGAIERVGLDGSAVWLCEDVAQLLENTLPRY